MWTPPDGLPKGIKRRRRMKAHKEFIESQDSDSWREFVISPMVRDTLSWLGVPFRGELDWEYGYGFAWTLMFSAGGIALWIYWRRGWIGGRNE